MKDDITIIPFRQSESTDDPLTELAREGARRMLAEALVAEADAFVASFAEERLPGGRQRVVRHGFGPERHIQTDIGAIEVRRPKVRDRASDAPEVENARFAFYDFPAEHWDHLRTSNRIESVFATVRHWTVRTKGALSQRTVKLMDFTLVRAASKKWRRLQGRNQLPKVIEGIKFTNGVEANDAAQTSAA